MWTPLLVALVVASAAALPSTRYDGELVLELVRLLRDKDAESKGAAITKPSEPKPPELDEGKFQAIYLQITALVCDPASVLPKEIEDELNVIIATLGVVGLDVDIPALAAKIAEKKADICAEGKEEDAIKLVKEVVQAALGSVADTVIKSMDDLGQIHQKLVSELTKLLCESTTEYVAVMRKLLLDSLPFNHLATQPSETNVKLFKEAEKMKQQLCQGEPKVHMYLKAETKMLIEVFVEHAAKVVQALHSFRIRENENLLLVANVLCSQGPKPITGLIIRYLNQNTGIVPSGIKKSHIEKGLTSLQKIYCLKPKPEESTDVGPKPKPEDSTDLETRGLREWWKNLGEFASKTLDFLKKSAAEGTVYLLEKLRGAILDIRKALEEAKEITCKADAPEKILDWWSDKLEEIGLVIPKDMLESLGGAIKVVKEAICKGGPVDSAAVEQAENKIVDRLAELLPSTKTERLLRRLFDLPPLSRPPWMEDLDLNKIKKLIWISQKELAETIDTVKLALCKSKDAVAVMLGKLKAVYPDLEDADKTTVMTEVLRRMQTALCAETSEEVKRKIVDTPIILIKLLRQLVGRRAFKDLKVVEAVHKSSREFVMRVKEVVCAEGGARTAERIEETLRNIGLADLLAPDILKNLGGKLDTVQNEVCKATLPEVEEILDKFLEEEFKDQATIVKNSLHVAPVIQNHLVVVLKDTVCDEPKEELVEMLKKALIGKSPIDVTEENVQAISDALLGKKSLICDEDSLIKEILNAVRKAVEEVHGADGKVVLNMLYKELPRPLLNLILEQKCTEEMAVTCLPPLIDAGKVKDQPKMPEEGSPKEIKPIAKGPEEVTSAKGPIAKGPEEVPIAKGPKETEGKGKGPAKGMGPVKGPKGKGPNEAESQDADKDLERKLRMLQLLIDLL